MPRKMQLGKCGLLSLPIWMELWFPRGAGRWGDDSEEDKEARLAEKSEPSVQQWGEPGDPEDHGNFPSSVPSHVPFCVQC